VLEGSVSELIGLSHRLGRKGAAARYGMQLAEKCTTVRPEPTETGNVDDQVLAYASNNRCYVITNDRNLREALLAQGIGVISLRKQKRLELIRS
jgi:rRNA-processing protein FCF1